MTATMVMLAACLAGAAAPDAPADLVLRGGKIVTVDERLPEAEAVAARDGRIVAAGGDDAIDRLVGPDTTVIDLDGRLVVPGFIEGHGHFVGFGQSMMVLDLTKPANWDEVVALVGRAALEAAPGAWIRGRGWHQSKWVPAPEPNVEGYPLHHRLSAVTPDHPVFLTHASGHMSLANARAMELAGITRDTPDPPGGEILRDREGRPTGVFRETAQGLFAGVLAQDRARRAPRERLAYLDRAIELAGAACLAHGVTTFQDAGSPLEVVDRLRTWADEGRLGVRLWVMLRDSNARLAANLDRYRMVGVDDNHLTVRAIKRSIDGALGAHGAWMLEPYEDLPDSSGLNTSPLESIRRTGELALAHDYQLCVHAIGDRANRAMLDLFADLFAALPEERDLRWRIEHAQHLDPADIPRFAELGVIASMQANHATSDGPYVIARLGARRAQSGAYAWRSLLDSGAVVTNGTDVPVEPIDPIACFYSAVTRLMSDGQPFFAEQAMTRAEALKSYTLSVAYSAFEDDVKGSITPGKLADMVVLSRDIMTVPADEIRQAKVLYTIVGGEIVYRAATAGDDTRSN